MSVYLNKALIGFENIYRPHEEKKIYLNRVYENYTNFIDVNLSEYELINKSLKIALVILTGPIFLILSVGAILIDTANEMIGIRTKTYQSFNHPINKLKLIKKFSKKNKEYVIAVITLIAITRICIINKDNISSFYSHVKLFFTKKNDYPKPSCSQIDINNILENISVLLVLIIKEKYFQEQLYELMNSFDWAIL